MVADYKRTYGLALPIVGTLTDYAPHSYWIYNNVDYYVVPSEETARKLISSGVAAERVKLLGIPIDIKFQAPTDRETVASSLGLNTKEPTVLIMGGTQGLGPIRELVPILDCLPQPMQMIVVSGTNKKLYQWLIARQKTFRKKVVIYGFAQNIDDLMGLASVIVTKPGGITTAEALAKGLPMVILNPLPGQEAMNTAFLIKEEAAVKAQNVRSCVVILEELLYHESKLRSMGANARRVAKPNSANDITDLIFKL
jgi:processive 1,2-diacylglycerol beta-glucosyltransferase